MSTPTAPAPRPAPPPPSVRPPAAAIAPVAPLIFTRGATEKRHPRLILNAVEGWGKTTIAAHSPSPVFIMARGETGYLTLLGAGLVPEVPRMEVDSWKQVLQAPESLLAGAVEDFETVVLDAAGGLERLCYEEVCRRDFGNEWGEKGFSAYQRGPEVAVSDWLLLLQRLDSLWKSGKRIILLSHCTVRTFKNPEGPDFDRYTSDLNPKTWQVTHRWADAVLFGNFLAIVQEKKGRAKGIGGQQRMLYSERCDAYDAKNRYSMPAEIEIPADASQSWNALASAMQGGK